MFIAGLVAMLAEYQEWLIEMVADPVRGVAATHKFFPNLAELKAWLEGQAEREQQHRKLMTKFRTKDPLLLEGPDVPPVKNYATRSGLKALYAIPDVPPGWDAVDVAHAWARYGSEFHLEIQKAIETGKKAPPAPSVWTRVMEGARKAMQERLDRERGQ